MTAIERQLSQTSIGLLLEQPFFGHLLSDIAKEADADSTTTMTIRYEEPVFVIRIHPDFWQHQIRNEQERMGHLFHQLLHLFFGHLYLAADYADPFLFGVAADLQLNQYIPPSWLWSNALLLTALSDFPLEPEQSVSHYYTQLALLKADEGKRFPQAYAKLTEWYAQREILFESHRHWYRSGRQPKSEKEMARWSARSLVRIAGETAGTQALAQLPNGLRLELDREQTSVPEINWRKLIRQFAQSSRSTFLKETIHRPSKRYGTTPGVRVRRRQRLLVGVDTSGSVSREEQQAFFQEIRFLSRTSADITLAEFDAEIQRVYPYRGQMPDFVVGGGGTNFLPILEYANTHGPWDGVILFTDGFAPIPKIGVRPPLLWGITRQGLAPGTPMYQALPGIKLKFFNFTA
ncbi:MAG: hypothetical protein IPJ40_01410 [Saprospirales bacterium]|nr:hypothetical protein [Saprospirales bacterium]